MPVAAVIQARSRSERLPGKVLLPLDDRSMLAHVVERVSAAASVELVVVATSTHEADDAVAAEARRLNVEVARGHEADVLDRYVQAARAVDADPVVRITADCPLLDPDIIDDAVALFRSSGADYVTNGDDGYPRGLDVEVISRAALEAVWSRARAPHDRAHVTSYVTSHPAEFSIAVLPWTGPTGHRWTVDEAADLDLVRAVVARLPKGSTSWRDVVAVLDREPALRALNADVRQKAIHLG